MAKVVAGGERKLANVADSIQPQAWTEAFGKKSADAFEQAFAENVVLEASVLVRPIEGIDQVKTVHGRCLRNLRSSDVHAGNDAWTAHLPRVEGRGSR